MADPLLELVHQQVQAVTEAQRSALAYGRRQFAWEVAALLRRPHPETGRTLSDVLLDIHTLCKQEITNDATA